MSAEAETRDGDPFFAALDGFVEALLRGEPVDVDGWVARHPDLGEELRRELELVASLHEAAGSVAVDRDAEGDHDDAPSPAASRRFLEPGTEVGDQVIEELLGYGGMGEVYRAHHKHLDKPVALKVLRPFLADDPGAGSRFRQEVQAQASMRPHPNVVTAMNASEEHGRLYLVMELVGGRDLSKLVRAEGALTAERAIHFLRQAAAGLAHAHAAGLVHRDIKPSNLLIDDDDTLKVVDLGLARLGIREPEDGGRRSMIDELVGTLDYVAPEQAADPSAADARSDLYGLGCTVYFMLRGRAPFADRLMLKKLMAHAVDAPRSLTEVRDDLPQALLDILDTLLAKDPDARYESAEALLGALDEAGLGAESLHSQDSAPTTRTTMSRSPDKKPPPARHGEPDDGPWQTIAIGASAIALAASISLVYVVGLERITPAEARVDADGGVADAGLDGAAVDAPATRFAVGSPLRAELTAEHPIRPKDESHFAAHPVTVAAGTSYVFTLRSPDFDPALVLRDDNGFELAASFDAPGLGQVAQVVWTAERDGQVELLATSERAGATGRYLLHGELSDEPALVPGEASHGSLDEGDARYYRDDTRYDRFRLPVTEGTTYVITMRGEGFAPAVFVVSADQQRISPVAQTNVENEARTVFDAQQDGTIYVLANAMNKDEGGAYELLAATEIPGTAVLETTGLLAEGDERAEDESFYDAHPFEAEAGSSYLLTLASDDFDAFLWLHGPEGPIDQNDDSMGSRDSRLVFTAPASETVTVWANSYAAGETGQYQLAVRRLAQAATE